MQRRHFLASIPALAALPALAGQDQGHHISARKDLALPYGCEVAPCPLEPPARWLPEHDRLPILQLVSPPFAVEPAALTLGWTRNRGPDFPTLPTIVRVQIGPWLPAAEFCPRLLELACDTIPNLVQRFEERLFHSSWGGTTKDRCSVLSWMMTMWNAQFKNSAVGFIQLRSDLPLVALHSFSFSESRFRLTEEVQPEVFCGSPVEQVRHYRERLEGLAKELRGQNLLTAFQRNLDQQWSRRADTVKPIT